MNMAAVIAWLSATPVNWFVNHYSWVWPTCQTLHLMGLALLLGNVGLLDLRLLGVAKALPADPIHRLLGWGISGFVLNTITGVLFVVGQPREMLNNPAFQAKMVFISLAGLNVLLFYVSGMRKAIAQLGPGKDAPLLAKAIAGVSLFLWVGVAYWGRMLPYVGDATGPF